MPMVLISDGEFYKNNLKVLGKEEGYLRKELEKAKITDFKQVFLCFYDEKKQLHVFPKGDGSQDSLKEVNLQ
jgi:uncharacterized membrane protein YcaP (DUF421 family)